MREHPQRINYGSEGLGFESLRLRQMILNDLQQRFLGERIVVCRLLATLEAKGEEGTSFDVTKIFRR